MKLLGAAVAAILIAGSIASSRGPEERAPGSKDIVETKLADKAPDSKTIVEKTPTKKFPKQDPALGVVRK